MNVVDLVTSYNKPISIKLLKGIFCEHAGDTERFINYITSLRAVDLEGQGITSIDGLDMFTELEDAEIQNNQISDLSMIVLELLPRLRVLNLYNNQLTELPDLSGTNIEELNIAYNPIEHLNVSHLPGRLRALSVSGIAVDETAIVERYPDLKLFDSVQPDFKSSQNEVSMAIRREEVKTQQFVQREIAEVENSLKTDKQRVEERNELAMQKLEERKKPMSARPVMQGTPESAAKVRTAPTSAKPPGTGTPKILKGLQKEQSSAAAPATALPVSIQEELSNKYAQAMKELDLFSEDPVRQMVDEVIAKSEKRMYDSRDWRNIVAADRMEIKNIEEQIEHGDELVRREADLHQEQSEEP